jgi:cytochrome b561
MAQMAKWSAPIRILHWLLALLIIGNLAGALIAETLPEEAEHQLMGFHMATGILILLLVVARLIVRLTGDSPPPLANWSALQRHAISIGHGLLYLLMLAVPLSGYLMVSLEGHSVDFFGLLEIPAMMAENEAIAEPVEEAHEVLAFTLLGVALAHMLIGLKHHLMDRDGTLHRIWR